MENKIVLYSSNSCGVCKMLKMMLLNSNVEFEVNQDENYMRKNGILHIPTLEVNGNRMNASEAVKWIKGLVSKF